MENIPPKANVRRIQELDKEEIYRILPYEGNWCLLSHARISEERVAADADLSENPMCFGHFRGLSVMPGLMAFEAVGHSAALHASITRSIADDMTAMFAAGRMNCYRPVGMSFHVVTTFVEEEDKGILLYKGDACRVANTPECMSMTIKIKFVRKKTLKRMVEHLF